MRSLNPLLPAGRRLAVLDLVLVAWAAAWIGMGLLVASEVSGLKELSGTVRTTGGAVQEAGRTLESFEPLPLVGDRVRVPAQRIEEAGASAVQSGRSSRDSIEALSLLLGLAVAVIPSLPLLGFYVPLRLARRREARALSRALRVAHDDPAFIELLAERALVNLPYRQLELVAPSAWRGTARREALASAELARLGLALPRPRARAAREA